MLDVRQLVRDDAFELGVAEHLQDAFGRRDRGVRRVAAGRERVRRRIRNDVDLRHRQARLPRRAVRPSRRDGGPDPTSCALYMRRTILSENQYEPKFMTTAKTNAMTRPFAPPSSSPITRSRPLSSAEQQRRFQAVRHSLILLCFGLQAEGRRAARRGARRATAGPSTSTCSCAACAPSPIAPEAVQRRHAERRGEIAVRPAAGRPFAQLASEGGGHVRRAREEPATAAVRSIGGRSKPPLTVRRVPGRRRVQRRGTPTRRRRPPRASGARTSIVARASSATTFGRRAARHDPDVDADARAADPASRSIAAIWARQLVDGARALCRDRARRGRRRRGRSARTRRSPCAPSSARRPAATARARARRADCRASASIVARDVPLPISSSVVHSIVTGGCGVPVARSAPIGGERHARCPPSCRRCPARAGGRRRGGAACARASRSARRCRSGRAAAPAVPSPANAGAEVVAALRLRQHVDVRAGRRAACSASTAPQRSTAALSVLGDSSRTSVSIVCKRVGEVRFAVVEQRAVHGEARDLERLSRATCKVARL